MPVTLRNVLVTRRAGGRRSHGASTSAGGTLDDMNSDRRTDFPPVGHPNDYVRGLVAFIVLIGVILAIAFLVRLALPA